MKSKTSVQKLGFPMGNYRGFLLTVSFLHMELHLTKCFRSSGEMLSLGGAAESPLVK